MAYKINSKKKSRNLSPYRIITRESTAEGHIEVWQLPHSQYAIQYLDKEKGDNRWRVIVYVKDGEIRTRGDLPYKDYDSYLKALNHIQKNYEVEKQF